MILTQFASSTNSWVIAFEQLPSTDIPCTEILLTNFNLSTKKFESNYSKDQLLGIIALTKLWNDTKEQKYLQYAEGVWDYCELSFYSQQARGYQHNISNATIYTVDNSYGIVANLELYLATNNSKYLDRTKTLVDLILNLRNGSFFKISNVSSDIELSTQSLACMALLELSSVTKAQDYCNEALSCLNATAEEYLDERCGYRVQLANYSIYYSDCNAKLIVATARAYKLTNIDSFKSASLKVTNFLIHNLTIGTPAGLMIAFGGFGNETYYETSILPASSETQLWSCIALSEIYQITNSSSYLELETQLILATLFRYWDFTKGGFASLESNFIATLISKSDYELAPKEHYTEITLTLPATKRCVYSAYYSAYGIFNFTIFSELNINKIIFDNITKLGAYTISSAYQTITPFVIPEGTNKTVCCIIEENYFLFNASLSSGVNNLTLYTSIPIIFLNSSTNSTWLTINFRNFYFKDILVNQTTIKLSATNISLKRALIDENNTLFNYNQNSSEIVISNISYSRNLSLKLEYEDLEAPKIANVAFVSEGKKIDKLEKGKDVYLSCEVTDNNVLEKITVYYNDGSTWKNKTMFSVGNNKYQAWLGSFETPVEAYIKAVDISGNEIITESIFLGVAEEKPISYQYLIIIASIIIVVVALVILFVKIKK